MMNLAVLDRLCAAWGIATAYRDAWGKECEVPVETRIALLSAMGVAVTNDAEIEAALQERQARDWRRPLPPVLVVRAGEAAIAVDVALPDAAASASCTWRFCAENGERHEGTFVPAELPAEATHRIGGAGFTRYCLTLPVTPGPGYHRLELKLPAPLAAAAMTLIVAPARCYEPPALAQGKAWGPVVNLYALRSARNWGIGDFTDLCDLIDLSARVGAAMVGVNPLHALFPHDPEHASPYSPSSRQLVNALYLDPERIPEFSECKAAQDWFTGAEVQKTLAQLRAADLIDYSRAAALKLGALETLYRHFRAEHIGKRTARAAAFRDFQRAGGAQLRTASLFYTLQETLHARDRAAWGWRAWPQEYRDPAAPAVAAFAEANAERIEFFDYLHWNAELQLDGAGKRALERQLGVGIYQDLAVGADPGGAESWGSQDLYAETVTVGCPPDEFNLKGQDWGILPLAPDRLHETAYAPFIQLLRANMRHAGALRIDHVMGLMRLYWIPSGESAERGGYVSYPADDLLGVLALESERNRCMVIGEDLGTLPEGLGERLHGAGVLSYRLLYFQRETDGAFSPPENYPVRALAAVSTHDLPTLRGFWLGSDLDLRVRLDLYPTAELRERQAIERAQDRARLLFALQRAELLPDGLTVHPVSAPDMTDAFALAVHRFLARGAAQLLTVQPDNVFGEVEQVNVPATVHGVYPNWRHRLKVPIDQWEADPRFQALVSAMREAGRTAAAQAPETRRRVETRIPDATYRLQFNREFTFAQAAAIVAYLHELGVSHCYASPYFSARPGSMHGYDIVDHNAFNPEIGSAEDFEAFTQALRARGMGQILDVVPNHMGVMGADNAWWLDVLENGQASVHAAYFDIDWGSPQPQLTGKLLVPVLGDQYGVVLERGELALEFDRVAGAFSVFYGPHRFPVDPASYPQILGARIEELALELGANDAHYADYLGLISSFGHLPPHDATDAAAREERNRDKEVHKRRMVRLCERSEAVTRHLEAAVAIFNGQAGHPASFDSLDRLLESQPYRLAYWRVAADEINYRRFFDINELAALRMEDEQVFEATHRLIFRLLDEGKIDGLRIDHPDGLHDPAEYFRRLQARYLPARGDSGGRPPVYVVLEKILADHERLPEAWPVYGTTGYRFANLATGLFVDRAAEQQFERVYRAFTRERVDYDELIHETKASIMKSALGSELTVLANRLSRIARADRHTRDFTLNALREALAEIVACFPVYRTYIGGTISAEDRRYVEWALSAARRNMLATESSVLEFVRGVLLSDLPAGTAEDRRRDLDRFVGRFQQFTAAVTAKGVEDTAFYRYHRLTALNEVGGEPRQFGASLAGFHQSTIERATHWPHTMLATSTHDCKRAEDVRARIAVLSELPGEWWQALQRWRRANRAKKRKVDGRAAPSANDEYLIYQTLLGTWPMPDPEGGQLAAYRERIERYLQKALREAKVHTSWMNVNAEYETATMAFLAGALDRGARNAFLDDFIPFAHRIARAGMINSLAQVVLKVASPGVPDFYQGSELWQFQLVDPDNRGVVDYALRTRMLGEVKAAFACPVEDRAQRARMLFDAPEDGRIKLFVTWQCLAARKSHAALFRDGDYRPLEVRGRHAQHVCAFARVQDDAAAIAIVPRLVEKLCGAAAAPLGEVAWSDTRVILPDALAATYADVFTGASIACAGEQELPLATACANFPVVLLIRENGRAD
jgi:(1->4)-alpha-D-glucan 1-alpha-D-glucosylmutase